MTLSHLKYYRKRPLLPRPLLEEFRDGLMYGSACVMGEFFRAVLNGDSDEELIRLAKFYDYLEVQPLGNNEFLLYEDKYAAITTKKDLQELNKKVIEIGKKRGFPYAPHLMPTTFLPNTRGTEISFCPTGKNRGK